VYGAIAQEEWLTNVWHTHIYNTFLYEVFIILPLISKSKQLSN
jgi:hypothetical protein